MRADSGHVTIQKLVPFLQPPLQFALVPTSAIKWCKQQRRSQLAQLYSGFVQKLK